MELSSDTIRSASVAISSILRHEELDDILAMDWWFDSEMSGDRPSRRQQRQPGDQEQGTAAPGVALTPQQLEALVRLASLQDNAITAAIPTVQPVKWWDRPIWSGVIGGLIVAAAIALVSGVISHSSKDATIQITDEIRRQLDQRSASDAENLHDQIAAEVAKQLLPANQQIGEIRQDIGKIKDHLGIARNIAPKTGQSPKPRLDVGLRRFQQMDEKQFSTSLPALRVETKNVSDAGIRPDEAILRSIATKLQQTSEESPEYWPTVLQFIRFASSTLAGADVPPPGEPTVRIENNYGIMPLPPFRNSVVLLSGGDLGPVQFYHCRIIFTEHQVRMHAVKFIGCVFEFPATAKDPTPYLKDAVRQLLASDLGSISSS